MIIIQCEILGIDTRHVSIYLMRYWANIWSWNFNEEKKINSHCHTQHLSKNIKIFIHLDTRLTEIINLKYSCIVYATAVNEKKTINCHAMLVLYNMKLLYNLLRTSQFKSSWRINKNISPSALLIVCDEPLCLNFFFLKKLQNHDGTNAVAKIGILITGISTKKTSLSCPLNFTQFCSQRVKSKKESLEWSA